MNLGGIELSTAVSLMKPRTDEPTDRSLLGQGSNELELGQGQCSLGQLSVRVKVRIGLELDQALLRFAQCYGQCSDSSVRRHIDAHIQAAESEKKRNSSGRCHCPHTDTERLLPLYYVPSKKLSTRRDQISTKTGKFSMNNEKFLSVFSLLSFFLCTITVCSLHR